MTTFTIFGDIVANDGERYDYDSATPSQLESFLSKLPEGTEVEILINSYGGDVFAGNSMVGIIRDYAARGLKIYTHVVGCACSIASVVALAVDPERTILNSNSLLMIHDPWCQTTGNARELGKTIEQLELAKKTILSVYKTHFDLPEEQISRLMAEETWILATDAPRYGLRCKIENVGEPLKIAAKLKDKGYRNMPKDLILDEEKNEETVDETAGVDNQDNRTADAGPDEVQVQDQDQVTEETTNTAAEEVAEEATEVKDSKDSETAPKYYTEKQVNDRVSGIQSAMQKQINDLAVENRRIREELETAKNESISLKDQLTKTERELVETATLLSEKTNALEQLNARVLHHEDEVVKVPFREGLRNCKTPEEKIAFIKSKNWTI